MEPTNPNGKFNLDSAVQYRTHKSVRGTTAKKSMAHAPASHDPTAVAEFLKSQTQYRPKVGIICGSGLSSLSDSFTRPLTFKYETIPGFPETTGALHAACAVVYPIR